MVRDLAECDRVERCVVASCRAGVRRRMVHDPGEVLRDLAVTLAHGGDDFSAIEVPRSQQAFTDPVASNPRLGGGWPTWPPTSCRSPATTPSANRVGMRCGPPEGRPGGLADASSGQRASTSTPSSRPTPTSNKCGHVQRRARVPAAGGLAGPRRRAREGVCGHPASGNAGANTAADHIDVFETDSRQCSGVCAARSRTGRPNATTSRTSVSRRPFDTARRPHSRPHSCAAVISITTSSSPSTSPTSGHEKSGNASTTTPNDLSSTTRSFLPRELCTATSMRSGASGFQGVTGITASSCHFVAKSRKSVTSRSGSRSRSRSPADSSSVSPQLARWCATHRPNDNSYTLIRRRPAVGRSRSPTPQHHLEVVA